jgi:predicted acetyltransferase
MMRFHMDEVREREETLAALWASESVIYGRFGYGKAVLRNRVEIERRHAAMLPGIEPAGVVDLVPPETTLEHLRPVYQRMLPTRPGMYARSEQWWRDHSLHDPEDERRGASRYRYAIYHEDGETLGYAQYRVKSKWDDWNPASTVDVVEMLALTPGASAGLWRFLSGIDLVEKIEAWNRPEDEPLAWLLADPRRLRSMPGDSMWLRLVDVPAALAARRYRIPGRLVLEVRDAFCPWNEGRYRLEGDRGDAACERTDADPDLVLDARDLGAVYLGGARMAALSRAGLIHGGRAAVETADLMFSWDPPPWCPEVF